MIKKQMYPKVLALVDPEVALFFEIVKKMEQADGIFQDAHSLDPTTMTVVVNQDKFRLAFKQSDQTIREFLNGGLNQNRFLSLLYTSFGKYIDANKKAPCCMLCLRQGRKIAGSHWISKGIYNFLSPYWTESGVNRVFSSASLTFPLFCTSHGDSCEQSILSDKGESQFMAKFLPLITAVRSKVALSSSEPAVLAYDKWLYYCMISLFFRLFLVDLGEDQNWNNSFGTVSERFHERTWNMFFNMRQFLLDPDANELTYPIELFVSEKGLDPDVLHELPLIHKMDGFLDEGEVYPSAVIGIAGFYFVLSENESTAAGIKNGLHRRAFSHRVAPDSGEISIRASQPLQVPKNVQVVIDQVTQKIKQLLRVSNPTLLAVSSGVPQPNPPTAGSLKPDMSFAVQLPDGISFKSDATRSLDWVTGDLLVTKNQFVPLHFYSSKAPVRTATWLFKHKYLNFMFVILHIQGIHGKSVVFGYEFDSAKVTPDVIRSIKDPNLFGTLDFGLKTLRGTDHSLAGITDEKEYIQACIGFVMLHYYNETGQF